MHRSSFEHMRRLVATYLTDFPAGVVVDIGAYDVNGSYRPLFDRPGWSYVGIDVEAGPNVDVVLTSPTRIPMRSRTVNVVVCGQAFEHMEQFWLTWKEMVRILRPGGLIFLIAPSRGPEHRYPVDCWRFYPDGFRALGALAGLEVLEVRTDWEPSSDLESAQWGDTVGAFRRPPRRGFAGAAAAVVRRLRRGPKRP
jgi:SAM-dependent methyltransferase